MSKILSFEDIKTGLKDRRLYHVEKASYVSYTTLKQLINNTNDDFRLNTLKRISRYLLNSSPWKPDQAFYERMIDIDAIIHEVRRELLKRDSAQLATLCGISYPTLKRIENLSNDNFRLRTLKHICKYLYRNPAPGENPNQNLVSLFKGQIDL